MVQPNELMLIGYWNGPGDLAKWPDPRHFFDPDWDSDERERTVSYLTRGYYARAYMGKSTCRMCGMLNGFAEYSDG
jgi:hypothetical protein